MTEFTSRLLVGFLVLSCLAHAQAFRTFRTLLSPVPVAAFNANVVGTGSVTATLTGNRLAISGTYQGLAQHGHPGDDAEDKESQAPESERASSERPCLRRVSISWLDEATTRSEVPLLSADGG